MSDQPKSTPPHLGAWPGESLASSELLTEEATAQAVAAWPGWEMACGSQLVGSKIIVPSRAEVETYLSGDPRLADLLIRICADLRKTFDPETELSLEVYHDPEIDDRYLTIYVRGANYSPEFVDQIERVSRKFDDAFSKVQGYILITTDFRRPRGK